MDYKGEQIISLLLSGDESTFEKVYKHFFSPLHAYAINMVKDEDIAKGMVQNVFLKLWERRERLSFSGSIQAYLYGAVYHECLNHLRHEKVKLKNQLYVENTKIESNEAMIGMELMDLKANLHDAINELPERCRTVFHLSRFEGLKYKEIAEQLNISNKTVEAQMGKALKTLRVKLLEYLPLIIWFIILLKNL